ncbi:MAG: cyclic-di-AMP receptor [Anaerolineae bacterium]|nr:cyclic-di-AMP receptor [Anaerolineae bacterium]
MTEPTPITPPINQLVIVTASGSQAGPLTERLNRDGFWVTQVNSSGGLLYDSTVSLLIGVNQARLSRLLEHIRKHCSTQQRFVLAYGEAPMLEAQPLMLEAEVGGATIYVLDIELFEQW